jgi:non-heme chloroperoxidase
MMPRSVNLATWILEHLAISLNREALAGDLLEKFRWGRSTTWYWRQVLTAVGIGAWTMSREYILILIFSSGWSMLYPVLRPIALWSASPDRWGLVWPYSTLTELAYGFVPAIAFVWLGLAIYLLSRSWIVRESSNFRVFRSLSTSISALLVVAVATLFYLKNPIVDISYVMRDDFFSTFHVFAVSVSLAVSLAVAILSALPLTPRLGRRQRSSMEILTPGGREEKASRFERMSVLKTALWTFALIALFTSTSPGQAKSDRSTYTVSFVTIAPDVRLEVLDWGGTGRPVILLSGLGDDAHVYDEFAPHLTAHNHVYGITRKGFGASGKPVPANGNYTADHLGDDVLSVMDALKLDHPVLIGHSIAGEELSSIGSRYPKRVAGLIYLEAGMGYAYYAQGNGWITIDMLDLRKRIDQLENGAMQDEKQFFGDLMASTSQFQNDLQQFAKEMANAPPQTSPLPPRPPIIEAIQFGAQKYTTIPVPILAIFAVPHRFHGVSASDPASKIAMEADLSRTTAQANAFEAGVPSAHVVRLPNADHYVFKSNEAEVLKEIDSFLAQLP